MQAKKRLAKEIDFLDLHDVLRVYDLVSTLKNKQKRAEPLKKGYLRARLALRRGKFCYLTGKFSPSGYS